MVCRVLLRAFGAGARGVDRLSDDYALAVQSYEGADGYASRSLIQGVLAGLGFTAEQQRTGEDQTGEAGGFGRRRGAGGGSAAHSAMASARKAGREYGTMARSGRMCRYAAQARAVSV